MNKTNITLLLSMAYATSACTGLLEKNPNFNPARHQNPIDGFTCPIKEALFNAAVKLCYDAQGFVVTKAEYEEKKKLQKKFNNLYHQCFNRFFTPLYAIPKWCPNYKAG